MRVNTERDIDVNRLLTNLDTKSQCKDPGMAGYEVTVSKQLLRDAYDVIKQFTDENNKEPKYKVGQVFYMRDKVFLSDRRFMDVKGLYQIVKIEEDKNELRYHIRDIDGSDTFAVSENVLNDNRMIVGKVVVYR